VPATEETVLHIVCDNSVCPGNTLDPAERQGWTFASVEIYGETGTTQFVYCSATCAASLEAAIESIPKLVQPPAPGV
jgi:hypothetical protein